MFTCGPCCAPGELGSTEQGIHVDRPEGMTVQESAPAQVFEPGSDPPSPAAVASPKPRGDDAAELATVPAPSAQPGNAQPSSERAVTVKNSMKELTKKAIFEGIPCHAINPSSCERVPVRFAIDAAVHNFSVKVEGGGVPAPWAEQRTALAKLTRAGPVAGTNEGEVAPRDLRAKLSQEEFSRLCYVESDAGLTLLLCENSTDIPSCLRLLHFHRTQTSPEK